LILLISGSVQPSSRTLAAVTAAAAILEGRGLKTRVWDLSQSPLPIADPTYYQRPTEHPDPRVHELLRAATEARGFVLASPLYHNAYCGALKNCLDHLSIDEFASKPVGLISFGGTLTAIQVCDQLQIVVRGLYGLALPVQVVTVPSDFERSDAGFRLVSADRLRRLGWMADEIAHYLGADRKVWNGHKKRRESALPAASSIPIMAETAIPDGIPDGSPLPAAVPPLAQPIPVADAGRSSQVLAHYAGDLYLDQAFD
jgi:NAD(P)H-dependent FMN reductase